MPGAGPAAPGSRMLMRLLADSVVKLALDDKPRRPPLPVDVGTPAQRVAVRGIGQRDGECHAQDDEQDAGPAFVDIGLARAQVNSRRAVAGARPRGEGEYGRGHFFTSFPVVRASQRLDSTANDGACRRSRERIPRYPDQDSPRE